MKLVYDGKLTNKIVNKKPKNLDLIEIDTFSRLLRYKFGIYKFVNVINANVLKYNLNKKYDLVISNLPYNISSQVLVKLVLMDVTPKEMILMFQREFAIKLTDKKLNAINSIINCFYKINIKFHVSKNESN